MAERRRSARSFRISNQELEVELVGQTKTFPKYTTQILNLANQNAQGTRPAIVGQMTDLIQQCPSRSFAGWRDWYVKKNPTAIADATEKINEMVENLRAAMKLIDRKMISAWVEDLVLVKTFVGLRFQEAILRKLAVERNTSYRLATPSEESRGIDGYLGKTAISIKPDTYKAKAGLPETIAAPIIYYTKTKQGIEVDAKAIDEQSRLYKARTSIS